MNENTNPEVTTEETEVSAAEEITETPVDAAVTEENTSETSGEIEMTENDEDALVAEEATEEVSQAADSEIAEAPAKKKRLLQIPVIICICIVAAALIGYFVFTGFFLREPEGVTWTGEIDGATYYYEFNNDGTFNAYVGSVEIHSTYQKTKGDDGNTLAVGSTIGNFYNSGAATYEISGSRLLGNQVMTCSYGEDYSFTVNQTGKKDVSLELPKDFTPDEDLLGSWVFKYFGYDIYKVTFDKDGSMALEFIQDGIKYNGTYTIDNGTVNFTYYVAESFATPLDYSVEGDTLKFMGYEFVREGSAAAEATPDQQLLTPAE